MQQYLLTLSINIPKYDLEL